MSYYLKLTITQFSCNSKICLKVNLIFKYKVEKNELCELYCLMLLHIYLLNLKQNTIPLFLLIVKRNNTFCLNRNRYKSNNCLIIHIIDRDVCFSLHLHKYFMES